MAEIKTKLNDASVEEFLNKNPDEKQKNESWIIYNLMKEVSGEDGKMWGDSIIGFGLVPYQGKTCGGNWMKIGFSPRKGKFSLYLMYGFDRVQHILDKLGKHKTGKGCLYVNKLADIDLEVLNELIVEANKRKKFED